MANEEKITHVDPLAPSKRTSEIVGDEASTTHEPGVCYYNGTKYSDGAYICNRGQKMRCDARNNRWRPRGGC